MSSLGDPGRRAFLARIGLLGAVLGTGVLGAGILRPRPAPAAEQQQPVEEPGLGEALAEELSPVLAELARDTFHGLSAFALPGPDPYSRAQGTPRTEPGALQAGATDFLLDMLDNFVPFPDEIARPAAQALVTGLDDSGIPLTGLAELDGLDGLASRAATLDAALRLMLHTDATVPLSVAVASLLNLLATRVDPTAVRGPFRAPFARLSYPAKAQAFALLEGPDADLVARLDARFPQPLHESVSGLLRFLAGALLEFATFAGYTEHAVFDPATRQLTGRPVGWQLSGYQPRGPVEGWPELLGYYQGRTEVRDPGRDQGVGDA